MNSCTLASSTGLTFFFLGFNTVSWSWTIFIMNVTVRRDQKKKKKKKNRQKKKKRDSKKETTWLRKGDRKKSIIEMVDLIENISEERRSFES